MYGLAARITVPYCSQNACTLRRLDRYGRNVLRRSGRWQKVRGLRKSGVYQLAERIGKLSKLGRVKVVFSRRRGERKVLALVTDDLRVSMKTVVAHYLKRWAIEAVLLMGAQEVAGRKHPGKAGREVRRHGRQAGVVPLAERRTF